MTLTGKTRYRPGWFGRLVLQVEYEYRCIPAGARCSHSNLITQTGWRDARVSDAVSVYLPIAPSQSEDAA